MFYYNILVAEYGKIRHIPDDTILQTAVREFGQRNMQEANLPNIVSAANISRGSLYQYFSNLLFCKRSSSRGRSSFSRCAPSLAPPRPPCDKRLS
ncbi:MAG: TetR/AcrR family transcriptional regulator [Synergistaceae bacterium]|nr:TetR/AcrR family transcriptional regulator [Synergistaceae bacterium]